MVLPKQSESRNHLLISNARSQLLHIPYEGVLYPILVGHPYTPAELFMYGLVDHAVMVGVQIILVGKNITHDVRIAILPKILILTNIRFKHRVSPVIKQGKGTPGLRMPTSGQLLPQAAIVGVYIKALI